MTNGARFHGLAQVSCITMDKDDTLRLTRCAYRLQSQDVHKNQLPVDFIH